MLLSTDHAWPELSTSGLLPQLRSAHPLGGLTAQDLLRDAAEVARSVRAPGASGFGGKRGRNNVTA